MYTLPELAAGSLNKCASPPPSQTACRPATLQVCLLLGGNTSVWHGFRQSPSARVFSVSFKQATS